jgi:hypothetical protein
MKEKAIFTLLVFAAAWIAVAAYPRMLPKIVFANQPRRRTRPTKRGLSGNSTPPWRRPGTSTTRQSWIRPL